MTGPEAFAVEMRAALARDATTAEIHALLRRHRDGGLEQQAAYDALRVMREGASGALEDQILDAMDLVWGWCSPDLRVWDSVPPK